MNIKSYNCWGELKFDGFKMKKATFLCFLILLFFPSTDLKLLIRHYLEGWWHFIHSNMRIMKKMLLFIMIFVFTNTAWAIYDPPAERLPSSGMWNPGFDIPIRPQGTDCVANYSADNTDTNTTQTAINNCIAGVNANQAAYLPAGTYQINSGISWAASKVLRGAGGAFVTGTATGGDTTSLTDTSKDFVALGVTVNLTIRDDTNEYHGTITSITDNNHTLNIKNGNNMAGKPMTFNNGDAYTIFKTTIKFTPTSGTIITIGNAGVAVSATYDIAGGAAKGSNSITCNSTCYNAFSVGNYAYIDQLDTGNPDVVQGGCTWNKRTSDRSIAQIVKITGKSGGDTLTFDSPLYYDFSATYSPQISTMVKYEYAGLEDFYLYRSASTTLTSQYRNILMSHCSYCWVTGVESFRVQGRHVALWFGYRDVIRNTKIQKCYNYASGANCYGYSLGYGTSDSLIDNSICLHQNGCFVLEGPSSGNVIAYNYADDCWLGESGQTDVLHGEVATHCSHPTMNLFEGNQISKFAFDPVHGSSSHITMFRNLADMSNEHAEGHPTPTRKFYGGRADKWNYYTTWIGNILGKSDMCPTCQIQLVNEACSDSTKAPFKFAYSGDNCDQFYEARTYMTVCRHANYNYVDNETKWSDNAKHTEGPCGNYSDHAIGNSYYLTSKPSWWGCGPWPPIGPDLTPMVTNIPAKDRFNLIKSGCGVDTMPSAPPSNLWVK